MQNQNGAEDNRSSDLQVVRSWNDLPRDLQLEVLARARLPIKEWATLRAVSRKFCSLLSDPSFPTLYEAYDPPKHTMFSVNSLRFDIPYVRWGNGYHDERHDMSRLACESIFSFHHETDKTSNWTCPLQDRPVLSLVASNDGFVCFLGERESKPAICVCNPMIPGDWAILSVGYGGTKSCPGCLIGIGFDKKLGAGKIVLCGLFESSEEITRTLIYNAKNGRWRNVSEIDDTFVAYKHDPFVFGGYFCWVVRSKRRGTQMVMYFNVENEAWEQPILLDQQWSRPAYLIELGKQLCVLYEIRREHEVWKLDMDTSSVIWVKNVQLPFLGYGGFNNFPFLRYGLLNNLPFPGYAGFDHFDYVFGGEDVLYAGYKYELWICKMIDRQWHRAVSYRSRMFRQGYWNCEVRVLKPSLFRFHGGGQPSDCSKCRIDPSENNAVPMLVDEQPMMSL